MANGKLLLGSINLSELLEKAKKQHSAFNKATNGKIYANVVIWLNDEPDQFGNNVSIALSNKKDAETEKTYIGNAKYFTPKEPEPLSITDAELIDDDLPF